MTLVFPLADIKQALEKTNINLLTAQIEEGFKAYSAGLTEVPVPAHLDFEDPPGDCHIKYGYIKGSPYFAVKVSTGFYNNRQVGLPSGNGLIMVFCSQTGAPLCLLSDEGYLTDFRTALAGRCVAAALAPEKINNIGLLGCGVQGKLQLELLPESISCKNVIAWTRNRERLKPYQQELQAKGYRVIVTEDADELARNCQLIISTTPSRTPLIKGELLQVGTHITAVGADGSGKRELDEEVFRRSSRWIVDSRKQCEELGEYSYVKHLEGPSVEELGIIIKNNHINQRNNGQEITVADLTGVAVQDIQIATSIYEKLREP